MYFSTKSHCIVSYIFSMFFKLNVITFAQGYRDANSWQSWLTNQIIEIQPDSDGDTMEGLDNCVYVLTLGLTQWNLNSFEFKFDDTWLSS